MSKISELDPITGANTRTEDLFVIVNLVQGDDGTKNITRKELVEAIQYEIFSRITITGGTIRNVIMSNSTLNGVIINTSDFNSGNIDRSDIIRSTFDDGDLINSDADNLTIINSSFSDGELLDSTANNLTITSSLFTDGFLTNSSANTLTIIDSSFADGNIIDSIANNITITSSTFTIGQLLDSTANNLTITSSTFTDGQLFDSTANNLTITSSLFTEGSLTNSSADNIVITNSEFNDGTGNNVTLTNSTIDNSAIINSTANNVQITSSNFSQGNIVDSNANNIIITNSEFNDGIGNNVTLTNSTIDNSLIKNSIIANTEFQGALDDVEIVNATISSSSANTLSIQTSSISQTDIANSTIDNSFIENSVFENGKINDSILTDFDMDLTNKFERPLDEDSYFALKNVKTGETEQFSYRQFFDEISRSIEKSSKVHVSIDGDDRNPGTMLQPVKTLERGAELALEKAGGSYNRNGLNETVHISVGPGTHYTKGNIRIPDDCSITSTGGQYCTLIQALPGYEKNNCFLLGSGCYGQGFSFFNWVVDNFDYPEGGFAYAYRPGAKILRSPYVRDSSQLSNFLRLDVEPPLQPFNTKGTIADLGQEFILDGAQAGDFVFDDYVEFSSGAYGYLSYVDDLSENKISVRNLKGEVEVGDLIYAQSGGIGTISEIGIEDFPNPAVGRGGGVILADRRVLDPDSLYTYFLAFGATPRTQNGIGYVARDGAGVNGIGSLSIFVRVAFYALNGGQMTLNNSGTQFGDISMRAKGSTTIFAPTETSETLLQNTVFADTIIDNAENIIEDMVYYLTANTSAGGLGYQPYDSDKCKRDTGIIIDSVGYDVALNSNYWGRLNGITYRSPISQVVYGEQLTETVGAIEYLKSEVDHIFRFSDAEVLGRANTSFNETLNILKNGEPYASDITFADTGNVARTAARTQIQNNRSFIQDELLDWIEDNDEFFAYDSNKCRRDIQEYILPAVKYDMLLDTNYNSVTAGNAYYMGTAAKVINNQNDETVSAYKRLRDETDELLEANSSAGAVAAYDSFEEIIDILDNAGKKYTPKAAQYNTSTGVMVINIGVHDLTVGRRILIAPESFTFVCADDDFQTELKHPRVGEPIYNRPIPITAVTAQTITVNVGNAKGGQFEHRFVRADKDAISLVGSEIVFSDDANIPVNKRNARKQLQANRTYIQDYMLGYIDANYFIYDSDKCARDTREYILPAVQRDLLTGTNFNSIQTGVAYYTATASEVVDGQLTETVGAVTHLKSEVNGLISSDAPSADRTDEAFDKIISIMDNDVKTYSVNTASYDPDTGLMAIDLVDHNFAVGDRIKIAEESITFTCDLNGNTTEHSYPRSTDPVYNTFIRISTVSGNKITVNVGSYENGTAHTFVRATADCIIGEYKATLTPETATYDPVNGKMVVTVSEHKLGVGDWIEFAPASITFECGSPAQQITHPRVGDPAYRTPVRIVAVTDDTFTVYVGNAGGYTGAHTFISAETDSIKTNAIIWTDPAKVISTHTPTAGTYNPISGVTQLTIGTHNIQTGDFVEIMPYGITWECASEEISHPRVGEPNYGTPIEITGTTASTITFNSGAAGTYTGAHTFVGARPGSVVYTQTTRGGVHAREQIQINKDFLQDEVVAYLEDTYFTYDGEKCFRDTGLILDAVKRDVLTGSNFNSVFAGLSYRSGNASANVVINEQLTETVGAITWLKGELQDILSGTAETRADTAFDEIIDIMNNGQGNADAIDFGSAYVNRERLDARIALQNNKTFLQEEITAWIALNYPSLTYDVAKCERDVGYLVDSVSWDIQHGSNAASVNNARLYFDNAVSVLPDDQKVATADAFDHLATVAKFIIRGQEVANTAGNLETANTATPEGFTPTNAAYNPLSGVMVITIPSGHGFVEEEFITIDPESMTFECGSPAVQITHPRPTDPAYNAPLRILGVTSTTITVNVGDAGGYQGAHTFISATPGAIKRAALGTSEEVEKLFSIVSDAIRGDDFGALPAYIEPTYSANTVAYTTEFVDASALINGSIPKYQTEIIDYINETYNGLSYNKTKCRRDVGFILDSISEDVEYGGNRATITAAQTYFENALELSESYPEKQTRPGTFSRVTSNYLDYIKQVNILPWQLPRDQKEPTKLAYTHLANVLENVLKETAVTPTTGNPSSQDTTGTPADAATALSAKNLVMDIANAVGQFNIQDDAGALPAISGSPEYNPKRTFARQSLQMNRDFLIEETIAYINDKYFTYDENKCARDAGYILDAVKRDILTDTNYNSIYAGKAYRSGTVGANKVIDDQLAETIQGFQYLQENIEAQLSGSSLTRSQFAFQSLYDTLTDGQDAVLIKATNTRFSTNNQNAAQGLRVNKDFMAEEIIFWMALNYAGLTYSAAKCERDVKFIIDAVAHDIQVDSNYATLDVVRLYFENAISVLPKDQRAPTAAAWVRLAEIAEQIVLKQAVTLSGPSGSYTFTQNTGSFGSTTAGVAQTIQDLITIISDTITEDSLVNLPATREAQTTGVNAAGFDPEYILAVSTINGLKTKLQSNIVKYLNNNFGYLEYDEAKCRRDTGYIIDAMSHDIQYGGNSAMVNAAGIYFENAVNVLDRDQREPTREAFKHLGEVAQHVIGNVMVTPTEGNTETQHMPTLPAYYPHTPTQPLKDEVLDLAMIIANIADDENPSNIPTRVDPFITWVDQNFIDSKEIIESGTETLITDVLQYITDTYDGLSFPRDRCRRDMGYLIDAASHDVQYQTNHASRISAQIYFENGISVLPADTREQTADIYREMAVLMSDIVQEVDTANTNYANTEVLYTTTPQDFTNDPATATEGTEVRNLIGIVEDVIRGNSTATIPGLVEPDESWIPADKLWAADVIDENKDDLADDVQVWLRDNFDVLDYNKAKCRRDTGYLLDAFSFDLNYGGNAASRWNADFYYWNNIYRIPEDQRVPTAKSYRRLGEICAQIVLGKYEGQNENGELATSVEAEKVQYLADIFYNTQFFNDTKELPVLEQPDFTWEQDKIFTFSRDILQSKRVALQKDVVRYVNANYKFLDINLTRRDGLNVLTTIANDFKFINTITGDGGSQKATRTYVAGFFDFNGNLVFPIFNPSRKGLIYRGAVTSTSSVTNPKRNEAVIVSNDFNGNRYDGDIYYYDGANWIFDVANNTDLVYAFYKSWERMRDYIVNNYSPDADHTAMVQALFGLLITNVLRPNTITFGSLVESIAHQFNGASAGVNRTALPLNFRNIGLPISALASVLSEDGGRVRWSGADELNNQYFARGLRINGRTGRIEGRPFTSSVRKLARRASNSRAQV